MIRPVPHPLALTCAAALLLAACSGDLATGPREEAIMVEPSVEVMPALEAPASDSARSATRSAPGRARAGVITAGDIDDTLNYGAFRRYAGRAQSNTGLPSLPAGSPVMATLTGPNGQPAPGVRITLRRPGAADAFYSGYSGVDGAVTVFPALHGAGRSGAVELRAFPAAQGEPVVARLTQGSARKSVAIQGADGWQPDFLDLVFVVDTTGSMGDELRWLTAELRGIVRRAQSRAPGVDIRYGLIVYRDEGDEYRIRNFGFTKRQGQMVRWLRRQEASGGGDYPEAAAEALMAGAALPWRRGKGERLMFHIADAPPHDRDARAYLDAAARAGRSGVQIYTLGASGVAAELEFLMRQASLVTSGRYMFLTDDSGVGYAHAEPTVSCYRVTALNDLVARVLQSELTGVRVEADASDVVREVGTYRRGVCRN